MKHINTINADIDKFTESILFPDVNASVDLMTFVESPFANYKNADVVSKLFHSYMKSSKGAPAIPIFYFFGMMSHWNALHQSRVYLPKSFAPRPLNTWVIALSPSGRGKTKNIDMLQKLVNDPSILDNLSAPASKAALIEQLATDKIRFWWQDEASEFWRQAEDLTNPLSSVKDILLKAKGGEKITHYTKSDGETVIEGANVSVLFTNTIELMKKVISDDSFVSGLLRRFSIVIADQFGDYENEYHDDTLFLQPDIMLEIEDIFSQPIKDNIYTISKEAELTYERAGKYLRNVIFREMQGNNNPDMTFFDTYLLEANKYAVFHHQFHKKEGTEIDPESMQFGLRVSIFLLKSYLRFKFIRNVKLQNALTKMEAKYEEKLEKLKGFIVENENKKGFGYRGTQRKFNIKKEELIEMLKDLREKYPKFKTSLYDMISKDDKIISIPNMPINKHIHNITREMADNLRGTTD